MLFDQKRAVACSFLPTEKQSGKERPKRQKKQPRPSTEIRDDSDGDQTPAFAPNVLEEFCNMVDQNTRDNDDEQQFRE